MPRRAAEKPDGVTSRKLLAAEEKKRGRTKKSDGPAMPKKRRKRRNSWDYEDDDDDGDVAFEDAGGSESDEEPDPKPKKKRGKPRKVDTEPTKPSKVKKVASVPHDEDQDEKQTLELKHRARKQQLESDSQKLLQEVRDLALQEKKTQQKLIEKLKKDVTTLSKQAEEERKKRQKEVDHLVAERMKQYDAKQRSRDDGDVEKAALREHIKELEAQFASFKRSTGPDDVVTVNAAAASAAAASQSSEVMMQLNQANKLLEVYRLVTSTDIRLIQSTDDDKEADDCTEIGCTTTDSATGHQFEFELAVPVVASSEIEYLPSEKPPTGIKVPSYLRELSFRRSETTNFIRSVLDVVTRRKKG